jgi:hypothetical protein
MAGSVKIRPDNGRIRPEFGLPATESGDGRIPAVGFRHRQNSVRRISAPSGFRRPDVVGLWRRLDPDDRQLLNSDDRISNMRVRKKSLISENDLRF